MSVISKRIAIALLVLLMAIQVPFVVRRIMTARLGADIERNNSERTAREIAGYREYKGVLHIHTSLGGHSTGSFRELIEAANANSLDFVIMTEHVQSDLDTAALTLSGVHQGTLFVAGSEMRSRDGDKLLTIPGISHVDEPQSFTTDEIIRNNSSKDGLVFAAYPERERILRSSIDGIEVFSLHTAAKQMNPFLSFFDLFWTYPSYPALLFASSFKRPDKELDIYDAMAAERRTLLFAGTDAHSNIGITFFGTDTGHRFGYIKLDPYQMSLSVVRLHVLIEEGSELSQAALLRSLKEGKAFVGMDIIGDTSGFSFTAAAEDGSSYVMGSEIPSGKEYTFAAFSPQIARFLLLRNGEKIAESANSSEFSFTIGGEPGAYRLEVYLDKLGPPFDKMPWILSNPIYVR
ncbi:hypothetical protein [Leptolyngbya sp. 7M]|uniref:hypothetical protein n=1 Tax=Leptolyngbya sp. 7M TaxID=2812896 RepID=UPI001B8C573A|nr:hypothetical protein [Leptolyngbya sp. 7M]QYO65393.1 hypothetical protein JVX88_01005 [Leptolyngbya sp. 7M]